MSSTDRISERIAKLLSLAEHPNTPPAEADLAMRQANSLMTKHAITEIMAKQSIPGEKANEIISKRISLLERDAEYIPDMRTILHYICLANRCRMVYSGEICTLYGTRRDTDWVCRLFDAVNLQLLSKIRPSWDSSLSYAENIYIMKTAGMRWRDINDVAVANGEEDMRIWDSRRDAYRRDYKVRNNEDGTVEYWNGKISSRMISIYKKFCAEREEHVLVTSSPSLYRREFVLGFKERIIDRLEEMRALAEREYASTGAELAILDLGHKVESAMYADHPHLSPEEEREREMRRLLERERKLNAMSDEQRFRYLEREAAAERREYLRSIHHIGTEGYDRGSKAGANIRLDKVSGDVKDSEKGKAIG